MAQESLKIVFGGGMSGPPKDYPDEASIEEAYKLLKEGGCNTIDTPRIYSKSKEWIGKTHGGDRLTIDSKTPGGFVAGTSNSSGILQHAKEAVEQLGVKNVDVYYIHSPDRSLDLADMLKCINDAHQAGYFKRFGLSNYTADEVERIYAHCQEKGYPLQAELAYRWVAFDSLLDPKYSDAITFGASKLSQIKQTLEWSRKGSVGEGAKKKIDQIWKVMEKDAVRDNFNQ